MTIAFASNPNKRFAASQIYQTPFTTIIPDPYFEYTTLLLPGTGSDGQTNNSFLDSGTGNSGGPFTISRQGNPTQGTFSPFSQTGWGNYFDGTGDYLACGSNAAYQFGTGDFTIEFWQFTSGYNGVGAKIFQYATDGNFSGGGYGADMNSLTNLTFYTAGAAAALTATLTANQWNHVAIVRSSATTKIYVNGSSVSSAADSSNYSYTGTYPFAVGGGRNGSGNFNNGYTGYISNFRVIKGTAVYTDNFAPPTTPLTAITNTQLLTCQSNRFLDTSTNNFTITPNGDSRVVAFSPFNPTASWSAATYGGSGYFDGSGDYLTAPLATATQLGTGDFTIEFWSYFIARGTNGSGLINNYNSFTSGSLGIFAGHITGSASKYQVSYNGSSFPSIQSSSDIKYNQWAHIALVRNGTTITLYLNGVSEGTITSATASLDGVGTSWAIGTAQDAISLYYVNGYTSNVRIVKGTAVYTGNFTPPSLAPLTTAGSTSAASYPSTTNVNTSFASSATSLLLNFTNAGIYDATSKNNLETVDGAQISNTTAKFGSTSIKFDGTGDYLISPSSDLYNFGAGDFTVEGWVYTAASVANATIIDKSNNAGGGTGWFLEWSSTRGLAFYDGSSATSRAYTVTNGQWYHIAVTRSGTNLRFFVDGTLQGAAATNSANITSTYRLSVGASNGTYQFQFNGYIQDLRVTKGYARYTANFTPPTAAFPTL